jgi:hypothetical protein
MGAGERFCEGCGAATPTSASARGAAPQSTAAPTAVTLPPGARPEPQADALAPALPSFSAKASAITAQVSRRTIAIVLAALVAVCVVVVVVLSRDTAAPADAFVGDWATSDAEVQMAGLSITKLDGDLYQLRFVGSDPFLAWRDDDVLNVDLKSGEWPGSGLSSVTFTLVGNDHLLLRLLSADIDYRADYSRAAGPLPDVASSPAQTAAGASAAGDSAVMEAMDVIQGAVQAWANDNGARFPDATLVNATGLADYVTEWPDNPFTGEPMTLGDGPGDFSYSALSDGTDFSLVGHLSNGVDYQIR